MTRTTGRVRATCSKNFRTAHEASSTELGLGPPEQAADEPRDPVPVLGARQHGRQLRGRGRRVIGIGDPGGLLDDLADRVEGDAVAVRQAAAAEDVASSMPSRNSRIETRFPDAGRPEQGEQVGGPLGPRPIQAAPQEVELRGPPDHRGVEVAGMPGHVG